MPVLKSAVGETFVDATIYRAVERDIRMRDAEQNKTQNINQTRIDDGMRLSDKPGKDQIVQMLQDQISQLQDQTVKLQNKALKLEDAVLQGQKEDVGYYFKNKEVIIINETWNDCLMEYNDTKNPKYFFVPKYQLDWILKMLRIESRAYDSAVEAVEELGLKIELDSDNDVDLESMYESSKKSVITEIVEAVKEVNQLIGSYKR